MARSSKRFVALAALALALVASTAAPAASRTPAPESTDVTALSLSGPVTPVGGVSGHGPTAPPGAPSSEATTAEEPSGLTLGTESVIGPDDRERVSATTTYPNSAVGQLELNGGAWLCTAFLVDDNSVVTSGHCAFINGELISDGTFTPGRDRNETPFGSCSVESAWVPSGFSVDNRVEYDYAVLNLSPGCDTIGAETGTYGLFTRSGSLAQVKANVQGYPGDAETTVNFGTQKRAHGKIARSQKRLVFYPMDTTGGQSGAPVWRQRSAGDCVGPCALAVHGYGTDPESAGIWFDNNAGIRLTPFRIGQILDIAGQNDL